MVRPVAAQKTEPTTPLLNVDLRFLVIPGLYLLLLYPPYFRGLFFAPDLLFTQMFTAVLFALCWYDRLIKRDPEFLSTPLDFAAFGMVVAYALSIIPGVDKHEAVGGTLKALNYFMVYWITSKVVRNPRSLTWILRMLVIGGIGVAAIGLGAAAGRISYPGAVVGNRILSTFQYPNAFGAYLMMISLAGLALWAQEKSTFWRLVGALGNYLLLLGIFGSLSRGVWLVYPFAFFALVVGLPGNFRWRAVFGQGLTAMFALVVAVRGFAADFPNPHLLKYVIGGAVMVVAGELVFTVGLHWLSSQRPVVRRVLGTFAAVYMVALVVTYFAYAATAIPTGIGEAVPDSMERRAQSIEKSDPSFMARLIMDRDALRIVRDHPIFGVGAGGWNALYHQYQSALYWTTETHNAFLQTWVETGTLGFLIYLAAWFFQGLSVLRLRRAWAHGREGGEEEEQRPKRESGGPVLDDAGWTVIWGAGVAAFALGIHSFFDFDLSIPAITMALWTLFGGLRGLAGAVVIHIPSTAVARTNLPMQGALKSPVAAARAGNPSRIEAAPAKLLAAVVLATAFALALFIPSRNYYRAGLAAAEGARALLASDFAKAEIKYKDARRLDPLMGNYAVDLAQVYTAAALSGDQAWRDRARENLDQAVRSQPFNLILRLKMVEVSSLLGDVDREASEADTIIKMVPLSLQSYETAGRAFIVAGRYYLHKGQPEKARRYAAKALELPGKVEDRAKWIGPRSQKAWMGERLTVSPTLQLIAGQAHYLKGDDRSAVATLEKAANSQVTALEAKVWLAAALRKAGEPTRSERVLDEILSLNPNLKVEYDRLILARL